MYILGKIYVLIIASEFTNPHWLGHTQSTVLGSGGEWYRDIEKAAFTLKWLRGLAGDNILEGSPLINSRLANVRIYTPTQIPSHH